MFQFPALRGRVAILCGIAALCLLTAAPQADEQAVTWTHVVNASVLPENVLQKTGGQNSVGDAGATSAEELTAGDGYLRTGQIRSIDDVHGGLGHLDMGHGYAIGADTFNPLPNATIRLDFPVATTTRPVGPPVHFNNRWDVAAANHIAHGNARPLGSGERPYACGSNASRVTDVADEVVCFFADGALDVLVIARVLTDLDASGGNDVDGDDYEQTPKGNLDVMGRYFLWTTNLRGGGRLDAVLVKILAERFTGR